ncbi:MAG: hypothetical protein J6W84_03340 [Bacteroidales bacterium]|nr:hypothetical protein [Bacteroidales bacterium]
MIGDKMLLYDRENERFFAGWKAATKRQADELVPMWSEWGKDAMVIYRLSVAYRIKETLGIGVRIVSETEAHKIDSMRRYREANGGGK